MFLCKFRACSFRDAFLCRAFLVFAVGLCMRDTPSPVEYRCVYSGIAFPLSSCFACCSCQHCTADELSAGPCISFGLAAAKGHNERVAGSLEFVSQTLPAFDLLS